MPSSRTNSDADGTEQLLQASTRPADAAVQLGARVAEARVQAGLTLAAVAERDGVSPAYLSQIEAGSANPTVRTLSRLAAVLGTDLAWLFEDSRTSEPQPPAGFEAYHSPAALATRTAGGHGIWDLTAAGSSRLAARLVHGTAGDHAEPLTHSGEELVIVLRGTCTLSVDGRTHALAVGDACHFSAAKLHNITDASPDLTLSIVLSEE
jgi:transcriptional regulator with XRE-family HTH domain